MEVIDTDFEVFEETLEPDIRSLRAVGASLLGQVLCADDLDDGAISLKIKSKGVLDIIGDVVDCMAHEYDPLQRSAVIPDHTWAHERVGEDFLSYFYADKFAGTKVESF